MPNVRRAGPVTTDPARHKVINPPTDITKIKSTDARASFRSALAGAAFDRLKDALESVECRPRDHVSYVLALCPAHDDREPSLAVYRKPGRARVVCHAGCDDVAVLAPSGSGWRIFSTSRAPRTPPLDVSRASPRFGPFGPYGGVWRLWSLLWWSGRTATPMRPAGRFT